MSYVEVAAHTGFGYFVLNRKVHTFYSKDQALEFIRSFQEKQEISAEAARKLRAIVFGARELPKESDKQPFVSNQYQVACFA